MRSASGEATYAPSLLLLTCRVADCPHISGHFTNERRHDRHEIRNPRRHAHRLGCADRDGRRRRAARRCVSSARGGQISGHSQLRALRQGIGVPGRLQGQLGAARSKRRPKCCKDRATNIRTGNWSIRRNGCRTGMSAFASIRAAPAARPAFSTSGRRARRSISITASNGPARSLGATARSASTAFPTTR